MKVLQRDVTIPITRVRGQNRQPFWETRGLRADIVVETEFENFVIDTKWKVLKSNKPSDDDLKQMFVYNLHYDTDLSILLYPKTTLSTNDKKPFRNSEFQDKNCQLAFTDLFDTNGQLEKHLGYRLYNELLKNEIEKNDKQTNN